MNFKKFYILKFKEGWSWEKYTMTKKWLWKVMACIICFLSSYFPLKEFFYNLNYAITLSLCAHGFLDFACFSSTKFFNTQSTFGREEALFIKFDRNFHILFEIKSWSCAFREHFFYFEVHNFHLIGEGLQKFTPK